MGITSTKNILFAGFLFIGASASGQVIDNTKEHAYGKEATPFINTHSDEPPSPGYDLGKYLGENIVYPDTARKHNIEGRVIIRFVIDRQGAIKSPKLIKGIGGGCDEEALRVVSAMPSWKPGRQKGEPVEVYYTLPIKFTLD
jgi:protein TonB